MGIYDLVKNVLTDSDLVFHYTKCDTGLVHVLFNNSLRLGLLGQSNDAFEFQNAFAGIYSPVTASEEDRDAWVAKRSSIGWGIRNRLEDLRRNRTYFLSCCSSRPRKGVSFRPGFLKMRMWAQYGESFKGLCFGLSKKATETLLQRRLGKTCLVDARYVAYEKSNKRLEGRGMLRVGHTDVEAISGEATKRLWLERKRLLFTKNEDFRDESEFRFLAVDHGTGPTGIVELPLSEICRHVIIADRFPEVLLPSLVKVCNDRGVEIRKFKFGGDMWLEEKVAAF